MPETELTLYSRIGCHLCEDMENLLPDYLVEAGLSLKVVYINHSEELEKLYGEFVPVLKAGEREICHYFLDVKALYQYMSEIGNPLN